MARRFLRSNLQIIEEFMLSKSFKFVFTKFCTYDKLLTFELFGNILLHNFFLNVKFAINP